MKPRIEVTVELKKKCRGGLGVGSEDGGSGGCNPIIEVIVESRKK